MDAGSAEEGTAARGCAQREGNRKRWAIPLRARVREDYSPDGGTRALLLGPPAAARTGGGRMVCSA